MGGRGRPDNRAAQGLGEAARVIKLRDMEAEQRTAIGDRVLLDATRPATRGECRDMPRPCPFVACKHHLMIDINPQTGSLRVAREDIDDMPETCSLDVAERGGVTLEEAGMIMNLTRERMRQLETRTLVRLMAFKGEDEILDLAAALRAKTCDPNRRSGKLRRGGNKAASARVRTAGCLDRPATKPNDEAF